MKSRRMRRTGFVARMGERNTYRILLKKPEGKGHYEVLDVSGRIILKWFMER
jgi:hypothetical protein